MQNVKTGAIWSVVALIIAGAFTMLATLTQSGCCLLQHSLFIARNIFELDDRRAAE